jgi:hypothetical protein
MDEWMDGEGVGVELGCAVSNALFHMPGPGF